MHDASGGTDQRRGDREAPASLRAPGRLHAAAAAQLHRRAHEPLHLAVDGRHAGRRPPRAARRPARQRAQRRAARSGRARGPALHSLLGLPERVPGLRAHRRPRVRVDLPGSDRGDPDAAARGHRRRRQPALRVQPVRGLLRGLPGQDRHPAGAGAPARPDAQAPIRAPGDAHAGLAVRRRRPLPARAAAGARAARARGRRRADEGVDGRARPARRCPAELPGVVA